jgi:uncharacterized protein
MSDFLHIREHGPAETPPEQKERYLLEILSETPSLLVALSGGADSAYLAWAAHRALGPRALAITARSPSFSAYDRERVEEFLRTVPVRHEFVETHELDNPSYQANNPDRCYYCKDELFSVMDQLAAARGFTALAYGVNADDTLDFRPGHRAASEHRVLAPLLEARLAKSEIRLLSRHAKLPTWDRPASACLASRLPYGTRVTAENLSLVERGEAALRQLGFRQFRVRLHDRMARVEIDCVELPRALAPEMAAEIARRLKTAGFTYVTLDLEGYRQGSLNESLPRRAKQAPPSSNPGAD